MTDLVRTILTGAIAGGIYSLIGVGLVVTYSVTGIFDLGYGGVAFASAMLFYELNTGLGWNRFIAALAVLLVFCPALGVLLDVALYRPLAKANETVKLVTSVGVLVALPALVQLVIRQGIDWFGWSIPLADDVSATPGVVAQPAKNWTLPGRIVINSNQLTVLVVGALVCLALWLMFKSRLGLEMRAVRDRRELALLRGVNERRTTLASAVIGSVLAGLAGLAGAPILSALNVGVFTLALVVAAAAVVLGRFNSPPWTFAGGLHPRRAGQPGIPLRAPRGGAAAQPGCAVRRPARRPGRPRALEPSSGRFSELRTGLDRLARRSLDLASPPHPHHRLRWFRRPRLLPVR